MLQLDLKALKVKVRLCATGKVSSVLLLNNSCANSCVSECMSCPTGKSYENGTSLLIMITSCMNYSLPGFILLPPGLPFITDLYFSIRPNLFQAIMGL